MRTRCPGCQTTFRVTAEQLKARAGKVRCGQCQLVFNVLDNFIDETEPTKPATPTATPSAATVAPAIATSPAVSLPPTPPQGAQLQPMVSDDSMEAVDPRPIPSDEPLEIAEMADEGSAEESDATETNVAEGETAPLSETEAQALGKVTGLILPRETTEIPGYSKWAEGVIAAPLAIPEEKSARWPFVIVALLLLVVLGGQIVFKFRSEIAIAVPNLKPALQAYSEAFKSNLPLPRHVELVSIEQSDLQTDTARGNLLVLNAVLRNRAAYEQAYPSLELSLTDTSDTAIARKVFAPEEFLPDGMAAKQPFKGKSDVAIRLWIEANEINAAGYRLYVFYP